VGGKKTPFGMDLELVPNDPVLSSLIVLLGFIISTGVIYLGTLLRRMLEEKDYAEEVSSRLERIRPTR
jgi:hypothetical protein